MPDAVAFLSDDWVAALLESGATLPARPGASASISTTVTGGPAGKKAEVAYRCTFVDGRIVAAEPGAAAEGEVDLSILQPYEDAVADLRGEAGLDVAFMRGRTKLVGPMPRFLALLPVLRSDEWRAARDGLLSRTAFAGG